MRRKISESSYGLRNIMKCFIVISVPFAMAFDFVIIAKILESSKNWLDVFDYSVVIAVVCTYSSIKLIRNWHYSFYNYKITDKYLFLKYKSGTISRFTWDYVKNIEFDSRKFIASIELKYYDDSKNYPLNEKIEIYIGEKQSKIDLLIDMQSKNINLDTKPKRKIKNFYIESFSPQNIVLYILIITTLIILPLF